MNIVPFKYSKRTAEGHRALVFSALSEADRQKNPQISTAHHPRNNKWREVMRHCTCSLILPQIHVLPFIYSCMESTTL